MKPVVLIILDGVGQNPDQRGNAVFSAKTPNLDYFRAHYPTTLLDASGEAVGLPAGFQGSSEVGHLSMGAGRIVQQELKQINDQIANGSIYKSNRWNAMMHDWKKNASTFHLLGLLQDEGVHAHQNHLFEFIKQAQTENPNGNIVIHPFLDGRDTPPKSTIGFIRQLKYFLKDRKHCTIGTIMGRYYGMDRAKEWRLTDKAYQCLVKAEGLPMTNLEKTILESYAQDKTPSGDPMVDEYIKPHAAASYTGIQPGDVVLHTNYRQDRAVQLSRAFIDDSYPGNRIKQKNIMYVGLTRYYDDFQDYLADGLTTGKAKLSHLVGEIIAKAGLHQLRLAETQKFPHVTSFFNGKSTTPFPNEDRIEINGRFDPADFANHPEMEAFRIVEAFQKAVDKNLYSFILLNFANGDMVGHTGDFNASVKAMEILDGCVEECVRCVREANGQVILTADHGNSDQMIDYDTGDVRTSHSLHPVDFIYISNDRQKVCTTAKGGLPDLGPTVLSLLSLDIPAEMTAKNLLK